MLQQTSIQDVLRYRRPRLGDEAAIRSRLLREGADRERLQCGLGIGLGQGGPMQGLLGGIPNFAAIVPGAYLIVHADRGITYGSNLRATAGNTSTATMAVSGTLTSGRAVPIWLVLTSTTAGNVYYDGAGTTAAMTGVSVSSGVGIALTGAGSGITITPSAGTLVSGNSWKATWSTAPDQSGNGNNATAINAGEQPLIGVGVAGRSTISCAAAHRLVSAVTTGSPSTTPLSLYLALAATSVVGQQIYVGSDGRPTLYSSTGNVNNLTQYLGGAGPSSALTTAATRIMATWTGSGTDTLKVGAAGTLTGAAVSNVGLLSLGIGGSSGATFYSTMSCYLVIAAPSISAGTMAALDAALTSWYSGGIIV